MMQGIDQQLLREYERQRARNEQQRTQRLFEATQRDPRIGALQDELRQRFMTSAREMIRDQAQAARLSDALRADVLRIQSEIGRRLAALGLPADYFELRHQCEHCKDTGYISEFGQQLCGCYRLKRTQLMKKSANLVGMEGQTFDAFDASVFPSEEQRKQAEAAMKLCGHYAGGLMQGGKLNLILMGESGLGKTFLLNCVADRAIQMGIPALALTAFNMLSAMRAYHFGETDESGMLNQMIRCELLLIDDLGTEPMLRNITIEYLFMLLNERMNARRHTVIATNLTPKDLLERYNERVLSRLMDRRNGEFIRLSGRDLRFRDS